jgi:hypothetical protein
MLRALAADRGSGAGAAAEYRPLTDDAICRAWEGTDENS